MGKVSQDTRAPHLADWTGTVLRQGTSPSGVERLSKERLSPPLRELALFTGAFEIPRHCSRIRLGPPVVFPTVRCRGSSTAGLVHSSV